jgi:hypothetical protein
MSRRAGSPFFRAWPWPAAGAASRFGLASPASPTAGAPGGHQVACGKTAKRYHSLDAAQHD